MEYLFKLFHYDIFLFDEQFEARIRVKYAQKSIMHVVTHKAISFSTENIFEMLVKKIHPQRFSAFFQIQFHPWNTFLITLYYIFTVYIYAHLEEAISRDQIFEAPHTAKIFHHEFRRRQLWFDDDHQATNVITRVLRPFASSPSRSLWKSHPHDGRKARIHAEESSV